MIEAYSFVVQLRSKWGGGWVDVYAYANFERAYWVRCDMISRAIPGSVRILAKTRYVKENSNG